MASILFEALLCAFLVSRLVVAQNSTNSTYDPLQYVDQLIGSSNGGKIPQTPISNMSDYPQATSSLALRFHMVEQYIHSHRQSQANRLTRHGESGSGRERR